MMEGWHWSCGCGLVGVSWNSNFLACVVMHKQALADLANECLVVTETCT